MTARATYKRISRDASVDNLPDPQRPSRFTCIVQAICVSAGLILASSCTTALKTANLDPFLLEPPEASSLDGAHSNRPAKSPAPQIPVRVAEAVEPSRLPKQGRSAPILQTAHAESGPDGVIRLADARSASLSRPRDSRSAVSVTVTRPRIELVNTISQETAAKEGLPNDLNRVDDHPDEYLIDGGDRALPIHYDRFNRQGLDTEDTVVEYVDHLGGRHVKPTNRVAIYAPRFGAVRSVTTPQQGTTTALVASTNDHVGTGGLRNRLAISEQRQADAAGRMRVRSRPSGLAGGANRGGVHQSTVLEQQVKPVGPLEKLAFIGTGRFAQAERARLATGIQAAAAWSRVKSPFIVAQTDGLQEAYAWFKPQELVGLEDERLTKGELRIVKLADRKAASPGDVITFTIRYDNLGDRELHHIRIIDNLTPRLEYIDDSATSDRGGRLDVEDNEEGSLVLKFVLDDPLPGHEGGVVTFQARVR